MELYVVAAMTIVCFVVSCTYLVSGNCSARCRSVTWAHDTRGGHSRCIDGVEFCHLLLQQLLLVHSESAWM
jgi:hypothetical protein